MSDYKQTDIDFLTQIKSPPRPNRIINIHF